MNNIKYIAKQLPNCRVIPYSKQMQKMKLTYGEMINYANTKDAFTDYYYKEDMYIIYYNDLDDGFNKCYRYRWNIAHELGIKGQEAYEFANIEKSNFSKMLKGERPLKYEFIIPLEKIFGVSLARLMDEDAYKLPVEKENVPFNKGFRYYAYLDDPQLYKNEFNFRR